MIYFKFCFAYFAEFWNRITKCTSCYGCDIFRIFCMGSINDARHICKFFSQGLKMLLKVSLMVFFVLYCFKVLNQTFPEHTFLMNGLVMGIKGILSFLSAPLIGALSDIWGRKFFLLITVFFTCAPIPLMTINTWWFFAMISISGIFAVTFSVVFAYVADVTTVEERSKAYGLVSATFAASLVSMLT